MGSTIANYTVTESKFFIVCHPNHVCVHTCEREKERERREEREMFLPCTCGDISNSVSLEIFVRSFWTILVMMLEYDFYVFSNFVYIIYIHTFTGQ